MPLLRNSSELTLSAPPPSPIPTAKGSRSAANESLSQYLLKSFALPELSLPEAHLPLDETHHIIPEEIDYRSLKSGDYETIDRLFRSAKEFGVFMITDHGISSPELQLLLNEADRVFRDLVQADMGFPGDFGELNKNKKQIAWVRSGKGRMKCVREYFVHERYQDFSEMMENIASKLDAIAEILCKIFVEKIATLQFGKKIKGKESILSLYKYNNNYKTEKTSSPPNERNSRTCDHTLCLHLPATESQFFVQSATCPFSFDADLDSIVVIVGQRIEEWSMGDFRCVCEEVICEPNFEGSQNPFSIELKCLSLNFDPDSYKNCKTISIRDQILIVLVIAFLCKVFVFLHS
ncbi:hypothetical protein JCGZ_00365 [Jatropha curcas]|uniref:Non-haem dioxygenase N-terminal domain-containing protein n=1 Tax=Jatropha curcas TaxID=180498 RepID=A0A067JJ08_JATCU|nr:hypothetical protein JCGZ_00365 [Jatropha curcas]